MIPTALIGLLPASLAEIGKYAAISTWLAHTIKQITHPFEFVVAVYDEYPGTKRADAWAMYRAAKYFRDQGKYLRYFGVDDVIDPDLAGVGYVKPKDYLANLPYRYTVEIQTRSPGTGATKTYVIYIEAGSGDTVGDVLQAAVDRLKSRLESFYRIEVPLELSEGWQSDARIDRFQLLQKRGSDVRISA